MKAPTSKAQDNAAAAGVEDGRSHGDGVGMLERDNACDAREGPFEATLKMVSLFVRPSVNWQLPSLEKKK